MTLSTTEFKSSVLNGAETLVEERISDLETALSAAREIKHALSNIDAEQGVSTEHYNEIVALGFEVESHAHKDQGKGLDERLKTLATLAQLTPPPAAPYSK